MATQTLTDETPIVEVDKDTRFADEGDHDRFAHYVPKIQLERAIFDGIPTRALCGKLWLPTKDATRFPVCQACKDVYEMMAE